MLTKKVFAVVGGDTRQACLANMLASRESGNRIYGMFLDKEGSLSPQIHRTNEIEIVLPQSDVVFFPIPMIEGGRVNTPLSADLLEAGECLDYIAPGAIIIGGRIPDEIREETGKKGIEVYDYLLREEFLIRNAVPTALSKMLLRKHYYYNIFLNS